MFGDLAPYIRELTVGSIRIKSFSIDIEAVLQIIKTALNAEQLGFINNLYQCCNYHDGNCKLSGSAINEIYPCLMQEWFSNIAHISYRVIQTTRTKAEEYLRWICNILNKSLNNINLIINTTNTLKYPLIGAVTLTAVVVVNQLK